MVRGSDLIVPSAGALARPKARKTGTAVAAGLAVINDALNVDVVQAIADASGIRKANQQNITVRDGDIALAKSLLARCLPSLARVYEVHRVLSSIVHPREPITPAEAMAMLRYLFGAMGKRRGDDATAKLFACADIFSPADAALADAFGFWKQTPTSRAVLGIAIKRLMATGVHEPAESELRKTLHNVQQDLWLMTVDVRRWCATLARADSIVFALDRPAWERAYAGVGSDVVLAMQAWRDKDPCDDAAASRSPALERMWEAKFDAEEAAMLEAENKRALPSSAACAATPAKRTRKPKRGDER